MFKTQASILLGVKHPVVLGGMGGETTPELVAAVSNAGGLGVLGCVGRSPHDIASLADSIRRLTDRPFGLNLLLFMADEASIEAVLAAAPSIFSTAWSFPHQDLRPLYSRAHEAGTKVMHMVSTVPEAVRAVEAGADIVVAQGTEGGGHVGLMGTMVLVPLVVRAVAPVPVLAAGGIADAAGLAAAMMMGAGGALMGTRFLASTEAPLPEKFKQAIVDSDGHNTLLTDIPDIMSGRIWPGAYARVTRNRLVEEWVGREGELRYHRAEVTARSRRAREASDLDYSVLYAGQSAGLIDGIRPAAEIVESIIAEAEAIVRERASAILASD